MTLTLSTDDYYLTMHIPPVPLSVTFKRNIEFLWDNRYCPNAPNTFPDLQKKSEQKRKRTTIRSALLNSVNLISQYNFVRTVQHYYMALSLYYFFFSCRFQTWKEGSDFINALAWELGLPEHALTDRTWVHTNTTWAVEFSARIYIRGVNKFWDHSGVWSKVSLVFEDFKFKRSIFQTFWRLHCCTKFVFIELETSNFGYLLIFWNKYWTNLILHIS